MSEKLPLTHPERLKWFRNVQFIGAGALALAGVYAPVGQELLFFGAATNVAQGAGAEAWRQHKLKKQSKAKTISRSQPKTNDYSFAKYQTLLVSPR